MQAGVSIEEHINQVNTIVMDLLKGRVGIVTGAGTSHGIGRSAVLAMARAGAQSIYACDLRPQDLPSLVESARSEGLKTRVVPVVLDVADEDATKALCQRVIQECGRLDFFCANAGISDVKGFWQTEASDFRKLYEVMALGAFYAVKHGSRAMSVVSEDKPVAKGSIVLTGSIGSFSGGVASIAYTAAKHAVLGVGRRGAVELAKTQIRVNTLAPGLTSTRLWDNSRELGAAAEGGFESQTEEKRQASTSNLSNGQEKDYIKQTSTPDDIANVMLFLASDMSQAVNAEYIIADRGQLQQGTMDWTDEAVSGGIVAPPPFEFK